ncbi:MAG TPA: histidinol-phosphate transaminase, partial [Anaerolineales bacterium]|nr:histidinol-phosphate transaminase [Anaerolineales bacterium]
VPWVKAAEPYSDKHMDVAWESPQILRMMSNENLLAPSETVLDAVMEAARLGNLYPGSGPELRRRLGEAAGFDAEHVVLGDGSTDVINFVVHTFVGPGEAAMVHVPTFPMYAARIRVAGGNVIAVPMRKDFYWDVEGMLKAVTASTKLIFVCSPNNPTGNQIEEKDLLRILDLGIPTFFDEAYYELEENVASRAPLIRKFPHMMVNRTMSKAFGLAGFRLGYLLCDPALATYFNRVRIPWNVGLITLAAALAGLEDTQDQARKRNNVLQGRRYIQDEINKLPGLRAYPSEGNFVLIDASVLNKESTEIRDAMAARGIFIRPMSGHNMAKGFIRVTIGTPEQNHMFVQLFGDFVKEALGT